MKKEGSKTVTTVIYTTPKENKTEPAPAPAPAKNNTANETKKDSGEPKTDASAMRGKELDVEGIEGMLKDAKKDALDTNVKKVE